MADRVEHLAAGHSLPTHSLWIGVILWGRCVTNCLNIQGKAYSEQNRDQPEWGLITGTTLKHGANLSKPRSIGLADRLQSVTQESINLFQGICL